VTAHSEDVEERGSEMRNDFSASFCLLRYTGLRIGDVTRLTTGQDSGEEGYSSIPKRRVSP